MFDVTPDDITKLNDSDLRELVARLCEAELAGKGLSPVHVTWGGSQTAPDGGLDVRVELLKSHSPNGFIPRVLTGYQVKKMDMPPSAIQKEMKPGGTIRPVIQTFANHTGAYIIVSSAASAADGPLQARKTAMRDALVDVTNADQLYTDFYDQRRLVTWVQCYPGLVTWVRERVGRALSGWRPYGSWSHASEPVGAEYLIDKQLRVHMSKSQGNFAKSIEDAIDEVRGMLRQPKEAVRLVGLSGVGKTRFAQALFDKRVGHNPLPDSLAVYTNLSSSTSPSPEKLILDLIENRKPAILIIDNCDSELHSRLVFLCKNPESAVSLMTIEYDVRDDIPEETQVITLDASSPELVEKLILRRYSHFSQIDAKTISLASGGNFRLAVAISESVGSTNSLAGLSNDALIQKLFWQRHDRNDSLLRTAQACSLVYSLKLDGPEDEYSYLAEFVGQNSLEFYRNVEELRRRDLVQRRGDWGAVLPHVVANWLAARALDDMPIAMIKKKFMADDAGRLLRSFCRRLSFLHEHNKAKAIAIEWFSPGGILGDVPNLSPLYIAMFENLAPVLPEAALSAMERANYVFPAGEWQQFWHLTLLRSLAYDANLFSRCIEILKNIAVHGECAGESKEASRIFESLFSLYLSGTHATIEQRLVVVRNLLQSREVKSRELGWGALKEVVKTNYFRSDYCFEFGVLPRNYGSQPADLNDVAHWYDSALDFMESISSSSQPLIAELRSFLADNFGRLWSANSARKRLLRLARKLAAGEFWLELWIAIRNVLKYPSGSVSSDDRAELVALESEVQPRNLEDRVRGIVLGGRQSAIDLNTLEGRVNDDRLIDKRWQVMAKECGADVANDPDLLIKLLPELIQNGKGCWDFGHGLASASLDHHATWTQFIIALKGSKGGSYDTSLIKGFLAGCSAIDKELSQNLLDDVQSQPELIFLIPALSTVVGLDAREVARLKCVLKTGLVPVSQFDNLKCGSSIDRISKGLLKELLVAIASQPGGFSVAVDILFGRLVLGHENDFCHGSGFSDIGQAIVAHVDFEKFNSECDYHLAEVIKMCLADSSATPVMVDIATCLVCAIGCGKTYAFSNQHLIRVLFEFHPAAILNAIFNDEHGRQQALVRSFDVMYNVGNEHERATDVISCESLFEWCAVRPDENYKLAATIISFSRYSEDGCALIWTEQAVLLLSNAPDPRSVLDVFVKRFYPACYSGSLAEHLEKCALLLDSVLKYVPEHLESFVAKSKSTLLNDVAYYRERDLGSDNGLIHGFE